jgi:hypothetical protein
MAAELDAAGGTPVDVIRWAADYHEQGGLMGASNKDLLLDPQLTNAALESLPASRRISLVAEAPDVVAPMLAGDIDDRADAQIVVTNVARIMAVALRQHDLPLFVKGIESLKTIWSTGQYEALYPVRPPDFEASLWENLGINLYALGALAVVEERWLELRELVKPSPTGGSGEKSWLRQSQVVSARSNDHYGEESMLALAKAGVRVLEPGMSEDKVIEGLVRFDLLAGLIIGESSMKGFFPNGAEFSEEIVESFVIEHLRPVDSPVRRYVFADDSPGMADVLAEYDRTARLQAALARYRGLRWGWRGFSDARTLAFIAERGHILEEWLSAG